MTIQFVALLNIAGLMAWGQNASVQGSVIASDTKGAVAHAAVLLRPMLPTGRAGKIIRGDTDQKGEFAMTGIAPGSYLLTVERAGYQTVSYPARFALRADETKSFHLRLTPLGAVTGTVSGADGVPLEHAKVMVSHYRTVDGVRVLLPEREVWTDASGNFKVTGVPAGEYLLSAFSRNEGRMDNVGKVYAPSYVPIKVETGRTTGDQKLQLGAARGFAIWGRVHDPAGAPVAGATVLARRQSGAGTANLLASESLTVKTGAAGEFLLTRLLPGKYRVMVTGGLNARKLTGSSVVELGNEDAKNVMVAASPGAVITGRIAFEGNFAGRKGAVNPHVARVALRSGMDAGGPGMVKGVVADDATFRMENVPEGPARLEVGLVNDAYYVKSISLNGQDLTNEPLNVVKDGQMEGVQVVVSPAAEVGGRVAPEVTRQPGTAMPVVVLFPEDSQAWRRSSRLIQVAHVDGGGLFRIRGIAPGNYRVVAVKGLERGSEMERAVDPSFLGAVHGQARQVAVTGLRASGGILQAVDAPR